MSSVAEKLQRKSQRQVATKQVRLKLVYVDFWSAVKLSFLVAVCLGIVLVVATILVWIVLNSTGIFSNLDNMLDRHSGDPAVQRRPDLLAAPGGGVRLRRRDSQHVVVGTALGAIASLLYNFSVRLTGGLLVGFTNN